METLQEVMELSMVTAEPSVSQSCHNKQLYFNDLHCESMQQPVIPASHLEEVA